MSARAIRDLGSLAWRRAEAYWGHLAGRTERLLDERRGRAAILMYHRVLADHADASDIDPGMYVRASAFDMHLERLLLRGPIRTLGELIEHPPASDAPPEAVVTFDDGWRDNLEIAWPILERYGVRATIFAVRDWIANARSAESRFLRSDEVRHLADEGIEFGAHTVSHPRLDDCKPQRIVDEMRASRAAIAEWTSRPCRVFAYPYGAHDERCVALAREHFQASVIVGGGWWSRRADPARLPRIGIHQDMAATPEMFEFRLAAARARGATFALGSEP